MIEVNQHPAVMVLSKKRQKENGTRSSYSGVFILSSYVKMGPVSTYNRDVF